MNRKEFVKIVAKKYDTTQDFAKQICAAVFDTLNEQLDNGNDVYIYGFGSFKHETRKGKQLRHPKTGELMLIPEKDVISFKRSVSTVEKDNEDDDE